jgi:hypothetical protein
LGRSKHSGAFNSDEIWYNLSELLHKIFVGGYMQGRCRLCLENKELQLSHIIPKFVFRYLKESSVGSMRNSLTPNRRVQDGEKSYLLCYHCEQLFSGWEREFSKQIFIPLHDPSPVKHAIHYGPWAMKFATSVSWRVLTYYTERGDSHLNEMLQQESLRALEVWRLFLLSKKNNTKSYEQHMLPVDVIESTTFSELSPYLNRYLLRTVHMDIVASDDSAYVYTKLGRVILFGFIREKHKHHWRGTKLYVGSAKIKPRDYYVPQWFHHYTNDKANKVMETMRNLSPKQLDKIEELIDNNLDEIAQTESFRAMEYDVFYSGRKAFRPKR